MVLRRVGVGTLGVKPSTMLSNVILLRAGSHGVPSLTHVGKSKHGGEVPTFQPQETIKI